MLNKFSCINLSQQSEWIHESWRKTIFKIFKLSQLGIWTIGKLNSVAGLCFWKKKKEDRKIEHVLGHIISFNLTSQCKPLNAVCSRIFFFIFTRSEPHDFVVRTWPFPTCDIFFSSYVQHAHFYVLVFPDFIFLQKHIYLIYINNIISCIWCMLIPITATLTIFFNICYCSHFLPQIWHTDICVFEERYILSVTNKIRQSYCGRL